MWRKIKQLMRKHQVFLLTTHLHPDADGIGSACALLELLLAMGKEAYLMTDQPLPEKFRFLDQHSLFKTFDDPFNFQSVDVMILLDAHTPERIGRIAELIDRPSIKTICIDHHPMPSRVCTPYTVIDADACCCGAMVHTLFKECGYPLNLSAATGIYASIVCDTGRFCYASTSRKAHKVADECIKLGVDPDLMYTRLFQHVTLAEIRLFSAALQHMETHLNGKIVIEEIRKEDYQGIAGEIDINKVDWECMHDFNKLIEDVECVILLREIKDDEIRVSFRSGSLLNVGKIAEIFGGGGHERAAGVTMKGSLKEVKDKILEKVRFFLGKKKGKVDLCGEETYGNVAS